MAVSFLVQWLQCGGDGESRKCFNVVKQHVLAVKARSEARREQP
jgi:hypothetical protein